MCGAQTLYGRIKIISYRFLCSNILIPHVPSNPLWFLDGRSTQNAIFGVTSSKISSFESQSINTTCFFEFPLKITTKPYEVKGYTIPDISLVLNGNRMSPAEFAREWRGVSGFSGEKENEPRDKRIAVVATVTIKCRNFFQHKYSQIKCKMDEKRRMENRGVSIMFCYFTLIFTHFFLCHFLTICR